jgi:hypothetical protein
MLQADDILAMIMHAEDAPHRIVILFRQRQLLTHDLLLTAWIPGEPKKG